MLTVVSMSARFTDFSFVLIVTMDRFSGLFH